MYGIPDSATASGLKVIENAPFRLHLGGSRRMAELHLNTLSKVNIRLSPSTDYDYYATYSEPAATYLLDNGFNLSKADDDGDTYELDTEVVSIYFRGKAQVVLRKDAEFYKMVFESIPLETYYYWLWKSSPDFFGDASGIMPIFNALFAVAHAARGAQREVELTPVVRDPIKAYEAAMKGLI